MSEDPAVRQLIEAEREEARAAYTEKASGGERPAGQGVEESESAGAQNGQQVGQSEPTRRRSLKWGIDVTTGLWGAEVVEETAEAGVPEQEAGQEVER
jgi:hypothetical protein